DLVWLDSALTHVSATAAEALLKEGIQSLRPSGVLLFAFQGRYSANRLKNWDWSANDQPSMHYFLNKDQSDKVLGDYCEIGYGHIDYANGGGFVLADSQWYSDRILADPAFL